LLGLVLFDVIHLGESRCGGVQYLLRATIFGAITKYGRQCFKMENYHPLLHWRLHLYLWKRWSFRAAFSWPCLSSQKLKKAFEAILSGNAMKKLHAGILPYRTSMFCLYRDL